MASPENDADTLDAKVETIESADANEVAQPAGNERALETAVVTGTPAPATQQTNRPVVRPSPSRPMALGHEQDL